MSKWTDPHDKAWWDAHNAHAAAFRSWLAKREKAKREGKA